MTLRLGDQCGQYLSELATVDSRIWVLDGDLADSDGAIHFARRHPERFIMSGIAEQAMVSMAAGMASCGLRPWVFSFAAFLCYRAYDQIRVCLSQSKQAVTVVGSHSGGCSGRNGKTHTALNDIALMASLPNMEVWAPADNKDIKFALDTILEGCAPSYLRLPRMPVETLPGAAGPCRWLSPPSAVMLITTGWATHLAVAARAKLAQLGMTVGHLHCLRVSPLPEADVYEALQLANHVFVIEDHYSLGGLSSLINQFRSNAKINHIGWPRSWSGKSGSDQELLQQYNLTADQIADTIHAFTLV